MAVSEQISRAETSGLLQRLLQSRAAWCLLAVAVIAARHLASNFTGLTQALGDTDDATRLVEVREFLAGAPWFDLTLPRFGGAGGYVSHWSRLIDVPLAMLLAVFKSFLAPLKAELAMRIVWPLMVLFAFLRLVAREAELRGGTIAAAVLLVFGVCAVSGLFQFVPGRIDHHNVQILCAISGLLMLARAFEAPQVGYAAGALFGLGLAVGYEAIALVVPGLALAGLMAALMQRWSVGVANAAVAFAGALAAATILTIPPSHWLVQTCDALSTNLVVLSAAAAGGLKLLALRHATFGLAGRIGVLAAAGAAGLVLYGAADPVCLKGPFGQVDPAVNAIWLDHVQEAQTIRWLWGEDRAAFVMFFIFSALGVAAARANWQRSRAPGDLFLLVMIPISIALAIWQMKLLSYASWLPLVPMAVWTVNLGAIGNVPARTTRLAAVVFVNQSTLALAAATLLVMVGASSDPSTARAKSSASSDLPAATNTNTIRRDDKGSCFSDAGVAPLANYKPGLIANDLDTGPFIVARTPHSVIAAPYHRLDQQIIAMDQVFSAPPQQARLILSSLGADYLVACITAEELAKVRPNTGDPKSLRAALRDGETVDYLEPLELSAASTALRAWRIVPATKP